MSQDLATRVARDSLPTWAYVMGTQRCASGMLVVSGIVCDECKRDHPFFYFWHSMDNIGTRWSFRGVWSP